MLTQAAMIIGGITTLLQLYPVFGFGMGLPSVMGGGSAAQAIGDVSSTAMGGFGRQATDQELGEPLRGRASAE